MSIRTNLSMLFSGIKYIQRIISITSHGQSSNFAIIQQAHKLEKGLSLSEPRKMWGYINAQKLVDFIAKEESKDSKDVFSINIGKAVLTSYIQHKELQADTQEQEKTQKLKEYIAQNLDSISTNNTYGGTMVLHKKELWIDENLVVPLFTSRHSIRDFADSAVEKNKLEKAVSLALHAPSACNRQPTQVYVMDGKDRIKAGSDNSYHADKYLILTGQINAFSMAEINDWIVSTSIFAAYLSLALHAEGIGSCFYRKEIIRHSSYNEKVKEICKIPDNEQIIIEMAIGNYKEECNVPISYRREAKDIIHYI